MYEAYTFPFTYCGGLLRCAANLISPDLGKLRGMVD